MQQKSELLIEHSEIISEKQKNTTNVIQCQKEFVLQNADKFAT